MKRKEKAHLKDDPFVDFIENGMGILSSYRKEILMGLGAVVGIIVIAVLVMLWGSYNASRENRLFTEARNIYNEKTLTLEQKIMRLGKIGNKSGISAANRLYMAALYFQQGDLKKAQEIITTFTESRIKIINDEKRILEAEIYNAGGRSREALDVLNILLADGNTEIGKDFILYKIALTQAKSNLKADAVRNFKRLMNEFPNSRFGADARTQLENLGEDITNL